MTTLPIAPYFRGRRIRHARVSHPQGDRSAGTVSGVAWVFVARGADCQWGPHILPMTFFVQGRIWGFWALRPAEMLGLFPLAGLMPCHACARVGATSVGKADGVYSCERVVFEYVFHWWLSEIILFLAVFLIMTSM